jgi:hypothetical protein
MNRCPLKPTKDQLEAAYYAVKGWAKQHGALIENASGNDFLMNVTDGHGILSIYWPRLSTLETAQFAFENRKGRVFAFQDATQLTRAHEIMNMGIVLDTEGLPREHAKGYEGYRMWLSVERKYLRWVRRHF